jgi:hypothetical protein
MPTSPTKLDSEMTTFKPRQFVDKHLPSSAFRYLMFLIWFVLVVAGCRGPREAEGALDQTGMFRQPHPTFTPTAAASGGAAAVPAVQAPSNDSIGQQAPVAAAPLAASGDSPRAVVNAPLVNVRAGPSTDTEIVATVERGAEYDIIGQSDDSEWWRVCCQDELIVWVSKEFVDTDGAVDSVPVGDSVTALAEQALPAAVPLAPAGQGGNAGQNSFQLIAKEQFPETSLVRVYLYVYDDAGALSGYTLSVRKNGNEVPVSTQSFSGQPAFTWPFQDARQRYQNMKVEFPDEDPAGTWTLQLIDPQGNPAGPSAEFTLSANDAEQELYVRYERGQ